MDVVEGRADVGTEGRVRDRGVIVVDIVGFDPRVSHGTKSV